jgi:hypothetical protein
MNVRYVLLALAMPALLAASDAALADRACVQCDHSHSVSVQGSVFRESSLPSGVANWGGQVPFSQGLSANSGVAHWGQSSGPVQPMVAQCPGGFTQLPPDQRVFPQFRTQRCLGGQQ